MPWRLENVFAVIATALVFAFCGWLIAGHSGAGLAAVTACAMLFLQRDLPKERGETEWR
jgi:hypothetical protein